MNGDICGRCEHFTLVDAPRAAAGEGRCTIYGPKNPEPFVQWDHPPTVLFWPVKDRTARDKRQRWIQQMQARESAVDAAPAASAGPPRGAQISLATSPHPTQNKTRQAPEIEEI